MSEKNVRLEVERLRNAGVTGRLRAVPVISDKRCFAPCGAGRCNCRAIFWGEFCLVSEENYESSMKEYLEGMIQIQDEVDKQSEEYINSKKTKIVLRF